MSVATPQPIAEWLEKLGLGQYAQRFVENEITFSILPDLTDADLKELGVSALGHRRLLLRSIAELHGVDKRAPTHPEPTNTFVAPEPRDTAERRQVTVMFSDLVGSTALSARMDPEDLREVISAYQKSVTETVRRFGGFVAKYMGDGVLIYFGYPQAHEDDAERAVRAGLELIAAVSALKSPVALQTRVGIATGLVVVGDLIGSGEAQERGIVGETPNLAARLQGVAEPNTVVIAESTRKLLGNLFELQDLGANEVKGIAEPVRAWAALRTSSVESRFEALRTATTPLVGRDEEIALLMRRWEQAKAGDGCVVLISGEPGIGKSRIAETIVERLGAEPHTRLRFFCSPYHLDTALYPAIAQLGRAAGFHREDTSDQRLSKLEAVLTQATNDLSEVAPLIADLLSIPTSNRYPVLTLTPQKRKEKALQALVAQAVGLSLRHPVLMIFEDVHWSDPTTRELLDLLIERASAVPLLVVITFRPEFSPPWVGRPQVTLLTLNRLPPRQRAQIISGVIGGKALPKEIADQIIERTDGIPLFVEELTKVVIESGVVAEVGDHYEVAGPLTPLAIPTSLHASLLARLDRLAPVREVAQIAAALGRSFFHELISAVAQIPQKELDQALDQLVAAELIFKRGIPPDAEYAFKHTLVQEATYSTLLRSRRQQIHARILTSLEEKFPDIVIAQPALLAHHCTEAGLIEKAVGYWLKAGQQSVARSAMTEAVAQLQRGLELLGGLPEGGGRQEQELELSIALGPALIASKGYSASHVREIIARARALAEQLNRTNYLVPLLYGQWMFYTARAEHDAALSVAEQVDKVGATRSDAALVSLAHSSRGWTLCNLGDFVGARASFESCQDLGEPTNRAAYASLTEDVLAVTLGYLGMTLAYLGFIDEARAQARQALLEARQLKQPHTLAFVLAEVGWVEWVASSHDEARRYAEEMQAVSSEHGFPFWLAFGDIKSGWAFSAGGQAQEGLTLITRGIMAFRHAGAVISTPFALTRLAEAYAKLGRPLDGLRSIDEAAHIIQTTSERRDEAEVYRVRGDLLMLMEDQAAEECYQQAVAVSARQRAKAFELRAATSLARLWRDQGRREDARELLAPVYGWFTEGQDTRDLKEARKLLDELSL